MIELQKGDYVATPDIKDEAEYHAIARAFMDAGCLKVNCGEVGYHEWRYHEWYLRSLCGTDEVEAGSRQLTPAQILATPQWVPEVGEVAVVNNDPGYHIEYGENVIGKEVEIRALFKSGDIDVAAVEYDASCYCFRTDMLSQPTTEEDRAVGEMADIMGGVFSSSYSDIAQAIYNAGYRKQLQPQPAEDMSDPKNWRAGGSGYSVQERGARPNLW